MNLTVQTLLNGKGRGLFLRLIPLSLGMSVVKVFFTLGSLCLGQAVLAQSVPAEGGAPEMGIAQSRESKVSQEPVGVTPTPQAPKATPVAFGDFFQMPFGPKGLSFTSKALALNGQWVSMVGYMVKSESPQSGSFILSPRPVEINDHADGDANDLPANAVLVKLDPQQAQSWIPYRPGLLQIQGRLELGRQESPQTQVSWIRVQLDQHAVSVQEQTAQATHQLAR